MDLVLRLAKPPCQTEAPQWLQRGCRRCGALLFGRASSKVAPEDLLGVPPKDDALIVKHGELRVVAAANGAAVSRKDGGEVLGEDVVDDPPQLFGVRHEGAVEGPVHLVHAKLPGAGAPRDLPLWVVPEGVGGDERLARRVHEVDLVEEGPPGEGVLLAVEEEGLDLAGPAGGQRAVGGRDLGLVAHARVLFLDAGAAAGRRVREGVEPLLGKLHVLVVGGHDVRHLPPDVAEGAPHLGVELDRRVHPQVAVRELHQRHLAAHVDVVPQKGALRCPNVGAVLCKNEPSPVAPGLIHCLPLLLETSRHGNPHHGRRVPALAPAASENGGHKRTANTHAFRGRESIRGSTCRGEGDGDEGDDEHGGCGSTG
mmetsp:Transcript_5759/g.13958  ORF Transcript_5759/g.13958 Transcript_5759/m.13958 type:complete len:369 (-) Transcript_5759:47-1153(-)